uniref:Uncharacterized protein n=1 Tax=Oryza meridionalis TaxID=40149 RepID=A0A0E0EU78_9ORYZ
MLAKNPELIDGELIPSCFTPVKLDDVKLLNSGSGMWKYTRPGAAAFCFGSSFIEKGCSSCPQGDASHPRVTAYLLGHGFRSQQPKEEAVEEGGGVEVGAAGGLGGEHVEAPRPPPVRVVHVRHLHHLERPAPAPESQPPAADTLLLPPCSGGRLRCRRRGDEQKQVEEEAPVGEAHVGAVAEWTEEFGNGRWGGCGFVYMRRDFGRLRFPDAMQSAHCFRWVLTLEKSMDRSIISSPLKQWDNCRLTNDVLNEGASESVLLWA